MTLISEKFEIIKSHRYAKHLMIAFAVILIFLIHSIYVWSITQSTDNAYIEADIVGVSPEVSGVIEEIAVPENSLVEAGQVIAKINDRAYRAALDKADASVEEAKREIEINDQNIKLSDIELSKAQEVYYLAQESFKVEAKQYKRIQELSKDNYASKKNLDNARIAYEKLKSELARSKFDVQKSTESLALLKIQHFAAIAKYDNAVAQRELALRDVENTTLRAPVGGKVGSSSLRVGNYVRPGFVLFSIVPMDKLYIKANFKETQISKFVVGMPVTISIDSETGTKLEGVIRSISPATGAKFSLLPPANATGNFTKIVQRVPVTIDFKTPDNIKNKIVPGMSVVVKVRT